MQNVPLPWPTSLTLLSLPLLSLELSARQFMSYARKDFLFDINTNPFIDGRLSLVLFIEVDIVMSPNEK